MTDFALRPYRPEDIPALAELWRKTFGDGKHLIKEFFRLLPDMGIGVAAIAEGQVVGGAYAVTGLELLEAGKPPVMCGYIYAVAVDESCRGRGIGRALTLRAAELARRRGAELICTLPAEASLYPWYESILGVRRALDRTVRPVKSEAAPCVRLSAEEYRLRRERLLEGRPHLRLSLPCLSFQQALCEEYGGGLFACGSGIAAAYTDGERSFIRELLCAGEAERARIAAATGAALGVSEVLVYEPARPGEGTAYIAAPPGTVPTDCQWNLSFD